MLKTDLKKNRKFIKIKSNIKQNRKQILNYKKKNVNQSKQKRTRM